MALQAIRDDPTLAELVAKHGANHTMIASRKRQVSDGRQVPSAERAMLRRAASDCSDSEGEKLHAKISQLIVEWDSLEEASSR